MMELTQLPFDILELIDKKCGSSISKLNFAIAIKNNQIIKTILENSDVKQLLKKTLKLGLYQLTIAIFENCDILSFINDKDTDILKLFCEIPTYTDFRKIIDYIDLSSINLRLIQKNLLLCSAIKNDIRIIQYLLEKLEIVNDQTYLSEYLHREILIFITCLTGDIVKYRFIRDNLPYIGSRNRMRPETRWIINNMKL